METAWIQVFVLTLSQCIAPAGKMVCQEETVQYHFTNEEDCGRAPCSWWTWPRGRTMSSSTVTARAVARQPRNRLSTQTPTKPRAAWRRARISS